jgi:hypothetical protein
MVINTKGVDRCVTVVYAPERILQVTQQAASLVLPERGFLEKVVLPSSFSISPRFSHLNVFLVIHEKRGAKERRKRHEPVSLHSAMHAIIEHVFSNDTV